MNVRDSKGSKTDKNQFTDLKTVLAKYIYHWPLFILGLVLAAVGAYAYMHIVNPEYEISASILVKDEKKAPEDRSPVPELDMNTSPKNAEAEIEILRSKKLVGQVVNDLQLWATYTTSNGLKTVDLYETAPFKFVLLTKRGSLNGQSFTVHIKDKNSFELSTKKGGKETLAFNQTLRNSFGSWMLQPTDNLQDYIGSEIKVKVDDPEMVTNNYLKILDTHLLDKTAPTIGIFTADEVPQRGKDFLNSLIKAYNEAAIAEEKRKTKSTIEFIDARLASLSGELSSSEKKVQGYRSSQGLADISSQTKSYLENAQTNDQKLNDVNVQLNIIDGIERYVNSNSGEAAPATIGINDPALTSLVERLSQLQLKKTALLATTPEGNPLFDPLNKQIAVTKSSLKETIAGIKSSLLNSKSQLQAFNRKVQSSINDIPVQERQFGDMKRQSSIKENLYVYLLQKREELALSYASTSPDARIVDQASVGDIKWPRIPVVAAVALLMGLGIPFLMLYFRHTFNNVITSRREIDAMNIPVLGELSYEETDKDTVIATNKNNLLSEQIRAIRTSLNFLHQNKKINPKVQLDLEKGMLMGEMEDLHADAKGRVTLFTSSISKEGKSFVSSNMAASLASSNRRTVLLEMDLRRPKVSKMFGLSLDHPGITDFLSYNLPVENIIQHSEIPNLDIIGCGARASDPAELLEKDRLVELINELRYRYDDVVIDSPPLHLVTDAAIIARTADVSVYIMRQGYTGKEELEFAGETYESDRLPNMTVIFNGIKREKFGYGYNYDSSYYVAESRPAFKTSFKHFFSRF
ncbi:polysaccharide biosynthesis tyrosine autokinase [Mucilaginibacter sp. RS28]|uniref:non-specific protein-tyrosine kinase n=1 Tax=Mucilaginibacter straminoryzae TaxID=2932774 RepID=A0A9X1X6G8_9SPHI|nr:tyrosine-protein kinase [Mucilaginibacter straminoryzae]MCJ8211015.1 polysaccharide biosynthesis tyrosine autokinase [Mucilaginibacter straminoryzae]